MQVNEKEFTQKLMDLSKSTMQKISSVATSKENLRKIHKIVTESKTEQEILTVIEKMATQDEKGILVGHYLDDLGVHPITVAEAVSDDYLDKSYQLIKQNPKITKAEFLQKMQLVEELD